MTIPSSRSLIFEVKTSKWKLRLRQTSDVCGRLRTSSGIFGNDRVVFKNPSTPRIKISRLYLRKSWQVYKLLLKVSIYLIYRCFSLLSAVLCNELFIVANVLCILFSSQMANRRTQCLVEATKRGFTLNIDVSGERNRCFYQCLLSLFLYEQKYI